MKNPQGDNRLSKMDVFDHLYSMDCACKRGEVWATIEMPLEQQFAIFRGEAVPPPVMKARRKGGTRLYDYIPVDGAVPFLLSERVIRVFEKHQFSEWKSGPVHIRMKKNDVIEGYHAFCVSGRCGPIDNTRSSRVRRPAPVHGGQAYDAWVGLYFDLATWDHSDFFLPTGRHRTVVTERVKVAMDDAEVSNVMFDPLSQSENLSAELL